jgi:ActR/RegA family two-component response regulator
MSAAATLSCEIPTQQNQRFRGLLYAGDESLIRLIVPALQELGIEPTICQTVEKAAAEIDQSAFDCAIIDCKDAGMPHLLLRAFGHSHENRECIVVAVINGRSTPPAALMLGTHMTMYGPSSSDHALRCLSPVYGEIIQRRRAAFHAHLEIPASLLVDGTSACSVTVLDLSANEMTVLSHHSLACGQRVVGTLPLPGGPTQPVSLRGDVTWSSEDGRRYAVKFAGSSLRDLRQLKNWINSQFERELPHIFAPALSISPM